MSEQEKKRQRIYDLFDAKTKIFLQKKSFLRKGGSGGLNKKWKEGFLTSLATAIKKRPHNVYKKAY